MYTGAYRFVFSLISLPILIGLGVAGYSFGGFIGALAIGGIPLLLIVKFLYF